MGRRKPLIVQIITRLIVGGAQRTVLELCDGLRSRFDLRVLCGPEEGPEGSIRAEFASVAPVTIVQSLRRDLAPMRDGRALLTLRNEIRGLQPDLVHTHSSKAGVLGRLAAGWAGVDAVHTIHGWGHTPADPTLRREILVASERFAARYARVLLAVSEDVKQEGLRLGIGTANKYAVVPDPVDLAPEREDFGGARAQARSRLGLSQDDEVVGWVGRFVDQKDPDCLVVVLQRLLGERKGLRAVLVGDGPRRREVEERLAQVGLRDRALFTGLQDARQLYPAFDVLVHTSRWEGQPDPRVIQEALAKRIPVVATRVSGLSDFVVPGRTGYVLEQGDGAGVARQALEVLADGHLRAPIDTTVISELRSRFGKEVSLARHTEIYAALV
jgi:glycosyltransferase involved in cell wall biosynthesis